LRWRWPSREGWAGGYAWTPRPAGAILGYIVDSIFVFYSDPSRLDRELAKGREEREEERRTKR
jgi:hypothetical protein